MKVILVPTDFTVTAANAVMYGAELALAYKAKLILLHVCAVSEVTPILWERSPEQNDIEADARVGMESLTKRIRDRFMGVVKVETHVVWGNPDGEIRDFITKTGADLVVIGVREANFLTSNTMWSDNAIRTVHHIVGCPVLAVKQKRNFRSIRRVMLTCKGQLNINTETRNLLNAFSDRFNAQLKVVMELDTENSRSAQLMIDARQQLSELIPGKEFDFEVLTGEDVFGDIQQMGRDWSADLLVMLPPTAAEDHSREYAQSDKMVLEGTIPVLTMY